MFVIKKLATYSVKIRGDKTERLDKKFFDGLGLLLLEWTIGLLLLLFPSTGTF